MQSFYTAEGFGNLRKHLPGGGIADDDDRPAILIGRFGVSGGDAGRAGEQGEAGGSVLIRWGGFEPEGRMGGPLDK